MLTEQEKLQAKFIVSLFSGGTESKHPIKQASRKFDEEQKQKRLESGVEMF